MEVISRQKKNLLLNGTPCEKDRELRDFLNIFPKFKGVTSGEVEKLENTNERLYNVLKSEDATSAIISNCEKEWIFKQPIGSKSFPCQLCGCTHSKNKFIIINKYTKKELQIGSSCIERFPIEERLLEGNDILERKNWSDKQIERASMFYKEYKTGTIIFKNWTARYQSLALTTTEEMDREFKNILNNGKKFYKNFINDTLFEGNTINTFGFIISDFEHFYKKCNKYINDNENDLYICTKDMEKYLNKDIVKIIKQENAKITKNTAKAVLNCDFMNRFIDRISNLFLKDSINLNKISENGIVLNYTYGSYTPLEINMPLSIFANNYSDVYFSENIHTNSEDILTNSNLIDNFENVDRFLNILHSMIKDKKYYFNFNQKLQTTKTIEIYKTGYKKYATLNYEEILGEYLFVLSMNEKTARKFLYEKIDNLEWTDKEEKKKYDIGNISSTTTKTVNKDYDDEYNQYETEEEYYRRIKNNKTDKLKI